MLAFCHYFTHKYSASRPQWLWTNKKQTTNAKLGKWRRRNWNMHTSRVFWNKNETRNKKLHYEYTLKRLIRVWYVNPRHAGGGGAQRAPPLWFFANSSWSTGNFALKLAIPLRATIPHLVTYDPGHNKSAVSDVRVTSCFADFDQQNGFTGIAATGAVLKLRSIDLYEMT